MCSQDIRDKIKELEMDEVIIGEAWYKEIDKKWGYNYCHLQIIRDNFLCVDVGDETSGRIKTIISQLYIKNSIELEDIISRLNSLRWIFPQVVSIPEINVGVKDA